MKKVMVVDDEPGMREMIYLMMQKEGYAVDMAENGQDLLNKINSFNPDLILLDVMMPGLTTKEILSKLKEKQNKSKIIILTVVRFSEEEKIKLFERKNVIDYITKPFELDNLLEIVKNIKLKKEETRK